jgi:CRISPR-associated endonuclease/helicase Cas3
VAGRCLEKIGFVEPPIQGGLSFHDLFQLKPNKMQTAALSTITDRGVYVIEAPMGMGKTEAALGAAYQLLVEGKASGVYFALPTQATSNRMYLRMTEYVNRIASGTVENKLIHSNSWLLNDKLPTLSPSRTVGRNEEDAQIGRDWFSSSKRALIAPFGIGTVDQALLGVVAAKHFFVRHFALAGKVVILDEIHSYDLYTGTLIDRLIDTLEKLGCTVIVLSATLSKARREKIFLTGKSRVSAAKEAYPLITGRQNGKILRPVAVPPPKSKIIYVDFKSGTESITLALEAARKGACVVWVCNTVDSAQQVYIELRNNGNAEFPIGLLHAHFPFWRREELENEWMKRLGKGSSKRCSSILVSTQIVEQSVDLDADMMITELAPTDMLLQRMGRLWRHDRSTRPLKKPRFCIIEEENSLFDFRKMQAKKIVEALGKKALVYNPYVLLRTLQVWKKHRKVIIPNQIRDMIEKTYTAHVREPRQWQELFDEWFATDSARKFQAQRATNLWQVPLEDEEGVQTRINELPTLSLVLCRSTSGTSIELIDGSRCSLDGEEFNLPAAQAIHRNLVRIPEYHFEATETHPSIAQYLRGRYAIVTVRDDGTVSVRGLKDGTALRWDSDFGLVIERKP